ncbi:MAG TPA: GntR family transcriptional regulator [Kineosporiaceae bacterium]|nr:GntR family transcriptional regulator [Kineosporiaceae bacterium]
MTDLDVTVTQNSPVPLYYQVARQLETAISSGQLAKGAFLPSEIELSASWGISRPTARRAIQELVGQGLLVRRRGVGTQVVNAQLRRSASLSSLHHDLAQAGRTPGTTVLELGTVPADEQIASALGLSTGAPVVYMERVRLADGEPLALMRNWLIPEVVEGLTTHELESSGLYQLLSNRRVQPHVADRVLGAKVATRAEARALHLKPGAALVTMQVTIQDVTGRPFDFGRHVYNADEYTVEMRVIG